MYFHYFASYYLNFHCNLISTFQYALFVFFFFDGHLTNIFDLLDLFNIRYLLWRTQLYTPIFIP